MQICINLEEGCAA